MKFLATITAFNGHYERRAVSGGLSVTSVISVVNQKTVRIAIAGTANRPLT